MSDVFLCYSRSDLETASRLAQRLRAEGWSVFLDLNTRVGQRWHKAIEAELHSARAVVVLWSARSRDSDYVLEEADYGKSKNIPQRRLRLSGVLRGPHRAAGCRLAGR